MPILLRDIAVSVSVFGIYIIEEEREDVCILHADDTWMVEHQQDKQALLQSLQQWQSNGCRF
jgi:hypothetical protein